MAHLLVKNALTIYLTYPILTVINETGLTQGVLFFLRHWRISKTSSVRQTLENGNTGIILYSAQTKVQGDTMSTTAMAMPHSDLKVISVFYWKVQADIRSKSPEYITETLKTKKFIKDIILHYSLPETLTLTLKTKSACPESQMRIFLTKALCGCGASNIQITRVGVK